MLEDRQKVEKFLNMITVYIGKFNILVNKELKKQETVRMQLLTFVRTYKEISIKSS